MQVFYIELPLMQTAALFCLAFGGKAVELDAGLLENFQ